MKKQINFKKKRERTAHGNINLQASVSSSVKQNYTTK